MLRCGNGTAVHRYKNTVLSLKISCLRCQKICENHQYHKRNRLPAVNWGCSVPPSLAEETFLRAERQGRRYESAVRVLRGILLTKHQPRHGSSHWQKWYNKRTAVWFCAVKVRKRTKWENSVSKYAKTEVRVGKIISYILCCGAKTRYSVKVVWTVVDSNSLGDILQQERRVRARV